MDTKIRRLADWFVARHTVDPALPHQWSFNRPGSTRNRPTERLLENAEPAVNTDTTLPTRASASISPFQNLLSTNLIESTALNSPPDPVLRTTDSQSTRRNQNQRTGPNYCAGNLDIRLPLTSLPPCISRHTVESVEFTNNSSLASEQRISRAAELMRRVMEEREEEQEQFRREMNRRERRERRREVRGMEQASRWSEQQEAITGPWCTCPIEKTTICRRCGRRK